MPQTVGELNGFGFQCAAQGGRKGREATHLHFHKLELSSSLARIGMTGHFAKEKVGVRVQTRLDASRRIGRFTRTEGEVRKRLKEV